MRSWWRCILLLIFGGAQSSLGNDYILTIGGGYAPNGNQASLEANVLFFQQTILECHPSPVDHQIYFADGFDSRADLQIPASTPATDAPAIDLLNALFGAGEDRYQYRDHQVKGIRGALNPTLVRQGFDEICDRITEGDRLIIYVTAHGSSAKGSDPFNTSIMCWNKKTLSMQSFSEWLDRVPVSVPVIMIMAQCYCGGFANTMFVEGDPNKGFATGLRIGFFAQRHDLPAAGCRPDIENDEEYSSYFWGAFMGRSRTGKPTSQVDCNGDDRVSFAEAHAYAVVASHTIDIPLKSSEVFLRQFSRIGGYDDPEAEMSWFIEQTTFDDEDLYHISGTVEEVAALGSPDQYRMVTGLAEQLEIPIQIELTEVFLRSEAQRNIFLQSRRSSGRRGRFSRRRDLRNEILEQWPELAEPTEWQRLDFLNLDMGESFLRQVQLLPSYEAFQQTQSERLRLSENTTKAEIKEVLFRRLIQALETILYAQNLPFVASPEEVERYLKIIKIEETSFAH